MLDNMLDKWTHKFGDFSLSNIIQAPKGSKGPPHLLVQEHWILEPRNSTLQVLTCKPKSGMPWHCYRWLAC